MHTGPADLAFGRKPLSKIFSDRAGLPERLRDALRIRAGIFCPFRRARSRVDTHDSVRPDFQVAELTADAARLLYLREKPAPLCFISHRGPAACRRPHWCYQGSGAKAL